MRVKTLLGLAACAAATAGVLTVPPAQAAQLPCFLSGSGSSASATCYSGASYTWRLVVDCVDTSNARWPKIVSTLRGDYITGDGTETLSCSGSLRADGRIETK
ncbi:hypothetical protein [Wenjunlia tyrosinilytica]|uniref:Secreted protein n=1 Tax=Wenjunlia tyrosinilytica TaxID=1544741 RepID=A0A918E0S7_9ACTN|nr:hypothetical protein [Wenjunlia tyrosinilytica]GGO94102.1 hypothetical protein GCM10012280_48160 [Wenjunlia tyrosinilytica]